MCVSGSYEPPCQFVPPDVAANANGVMVPTATTVPSRALKLGDAIEFTGSFFSNRASMDAVGDSGAFRYYTNEVTYVVGTGLRPWYGVQPRLEPLGFQVARWVVGGWPALEAVGRIFNCKTVRDAWDRPVLLFKNEWNLNQLREDHPDLDLSAVAPVVSGVVCLYSAVRMKGK